MKILIVSDLRIYALANSFIRAFKKKGYDIQAFDILVAVDKYVRLGKIGKKIHTFWPVEAWIRKGNRELALAFRNYMPDVVIVFGSAPVLYGTLAFFKSIKNCKTVLYWPDTLLNLSDFHSANFPTYDGIATYSQATIAALEELGCRKAFWLPFAGDMDLLGDISSIEAFQYDLSFAGGWRPERERALISIAEKRPNLKIRIRGTDWERFCKNDRLKKSIDPRPVYAEEFGKFIRSSRINLNVIDDTNYPAANMRFFEVPAAGGLQLSSPCPEMESVFIDRRDILYFKDENEMLQQIDWVLNSPNEAAEIRKSAHDKVKAQHNYINRIEELIKSIT